jgi:hypothetical protein
MIHKISVKPFTDLVPNISHPFRNLRLEDGIIIIERAPDIRRFREGTK